MAKVPFAGYADFDACVRANSGKTDPKAYCATIMRNVEGKNLESEIFCKFATLEKSVDVEGKNTFKGIVSSTRVDYDNERMSKKALYGLSKDLLSNTSVFFNHNYSGLAVAKTVRAWVVEDGENADLWAEFVPTAAKGPIDSSGVLVESVVAQMQEGTLKCLSVGGKKIKSYDDPASKGVSVLDEVKGLEYSLVGIGANPDAMMKMAAKSKYVKSIEERLPAAVVENVSKGEHMEADVVKENGPMTPNHPNLDQSQAAERYLMQVIRQALAKIDAGKVTMVDGPSSKATVGDAPVTSPVPVASSSQVGKSVPSLEEKIDEVLKLLKEPVVKSSGLAPQVEKFENTEDVKKSEADTSTSTQASGVFAKMISS